MSAYRAHEATCWQGDHYVHVCQKPSGRPCVDCGKPAGTLWGPAFCPDCDVLRLERLVAQFDAITEVTR